MIEWIVTSSALILLVLLLRVLIKDRVSPRLRYALWGLALLRLLVPVSLWESPVSVLRAAQINEGYQLVSTLPDNMSLYENGSWRFVAGPDGAFQMEPDAAGRWEVNQPRLHNAYGWVAVPSAEEARALRDQGQKAVDTAGLKRLVDVQNVLRVVWQAGIWLFMLFLAAVNGKFALGLRRGRRPDGEYHGRPVFIMEGLPTPCLFGLFRPAVYLNVAAMDAEHPEHILAHEYAHYRHGDHVWSVLRSVCLAVHWYNPLVWWAAALSRRDCELACDDGAIRQLGEDRRLDYGQTLLGMVSKGRDPAALLRTATSMSAGKRAMRERIALIVKAPRTRKLTPALAVLLACALAACSFGGREAKAPEGTEPSQGEAGGIPTAVTIYQAASSDIYRTAYITEPEEVEQLWEMYQSFEYEATLDSPREGGWPVMVFFQCGDKPSHDDISFLIDKDEIATRDGGYCRLKNNDEIYSELLRLSVDPDHSSYGYVYTMLTQPEG